MTYRPVEGVKIVEVAQFTFTPAAAGVLADWGADVIKVEHPVCAPQFAEHTDEILRELGKSEDELIQLKLDGVIT